MRGPIVAEVAAPQRNSESPSHLMEHIMDLVCCIIAENNQ